MCGNTKKEKEEKREKNEKEDVEGGEGGRIGGGGKGGEREGGPGGAGGGGEERVRGPQANIGFPPRSTHCKIVNNNSYSLSQILLKLAKNL